MFIPLKYGLERSPIGFGEYLIRCPHCESHQWAEVLVSTVYSHIYYIPLYPTDKDAMVVCKKCGLKRYGVPINANLVNNYTEVRKLYKHKWFTYAGISIICFPFLIWIILLLINIASR
jgi:transcription elongation factor Elf1